MFSGLTQKINLIYLSDHSHVMYVTVRRIWGGGGGGGKQPKNLDSK